jgi:hypothetical protein
MIILIRFGGRVHVTKLLIMQFIYINQGKSKKKKKSVKLNREQAVKAYRVPKCIPHCLDNRLTDGGKVASSTSPAAFLLPPKYPPPPNWLGAD